MILMDILLLLMVAALIRITPTLMVKHGAGVDQWFWKAYIDKLRTQKVFPPSLPQFLLDKEQWYPPLFPLLIAKLPAIVFERYSMQLSIIIDLLRMVLLMVAVWWLSHSELALLIAGSVYCLTPLLISYNMQLNPRGLGALFLDAMWLSVLGVWLGELSQWYALLSLIFAGLVLITHKMTTQVFWFTALFAAIFLQDIRIAALIPCSMLMALLLSAGFYRRVFRAHVDIISFWYKNWHWSGSNPILESPIYGEPNFESPSKYYRKGIASWIRRLQFVIGFNPWMPAVLLIVILAVLGGHNYSQAEIFILLWMTLSFAFALSTTVIPQLRCFGNGYLYGYNGVFPAALALGITAPALIKSWYWLPIFVLTILACLAALFAFFKALKSSRTMKVENDLHDAIAYLKQLPQGVVMCLPQHWHDVVAYQTGKTVAFGGHGFGFNLLQPIFPRLMMPISEWIGLYNIRYLLTMPSYLNDKFVNDLPAAQIKKFGDYQLYCFDDSTNANTGQKHEQ